MELRPEYVGYGKNPPPGSWPGGKRVAVSLVVNYEESAEKSVVLGDDRSETFGEWGAYSNPEAGFRDRNIESMFQYGSRVGIWRLLDIFKRQGVNSTFFACSEAFEANPEVAEAVVSAGHEISHHGFRWEEHAGMTREQEFARIKAALDSFARFTSEPIRGSFVKNGENEHTRSILQELGFEYDSYSFSDDRPHWLKVDGDWRLVLPYAADTNDIRFWTNPGFVTGRDFGQYLTDTLDRLVEEATVSPTMMSIGLHPRIIGRPARAAALEEFIAHAASLPEVWVARRDQIASAWREQFPAE